MIDSFPFRPIIQNSQYNVIHAVECVSRFPARRGSRPEDKPPKAERLTLRAAPPLTGVKSSWRGVGGTLINCGNSSPKNPSTTLRSLLCEFVLRSASRAVD